MHFALSCKGYPQHYKRSLKELEGHPDQPSESSAPQDSYYARDSAQRDWIGISQTSKSNHGYLLSVQTRYGIPQKLKRYTYGVQTCIWFITKDIPSTSQSTVVYLGYPWYAKTLQLINRYQIPDCTQAGTALQLESGSYPLLGLVGYIISSLCFGMMIISHKVYPCQ